MLVSSTGHTGDINRAVVYLAVVIIIVQSVPDCAVVVQSAFSETPCVRTT